MSHATLAWMDLEMTGLDPISDQILEIASIITDSDLNIIEQGPDLIIHCPEERLLKMDDWNRKHHKESDLWDASIRSTTSLKEAEAITLDFLKKHIKSPKTVPLCGNSIWQDRRFISAYMPQIDELLHYRLVDVSTIKELAARWCSDIPKFEKSNKHRALDDIKESIEELKYYRKNVFS